MERQAPYADHNVNPYAAAQMQQIALQRMQQNAGMSNFPGRPDSFISEKEHINMLSKEGHRHPMSSHPYSEGSIFSWIREPLSSTRTISSPRVFRCVKWYQSMDSPSSITQDNGRHTIPIDVDRRVEAIWDAIEEHRLDVHELRNEICNLLADLGLIVNQRQPTVDSNCAGGFTRGQPVSLRYFAEISYFNGSSQGGNAARSLFEGQMPDPKMDSLKQPNMESEFQAHEQDMEIGYEDKPSTLTFEGLEQRFLDEIMKLAKEQSDAEDAENAKHREKIIQINTQYQEKLLSLRAQQAKRRGEFLLKEAQARLHQYQQAGLNHHHPTNAGPIDPRGGYGGAAATEAHRAYATGQSESYRDRTPFLGGGRNQGTDARVPIPEGRVYNNTSARYY